MPSGRGGRAQRAQARPHVGRRGSAALSPRPQGRDCSRAFVIQWDGYIYEQATGYAGASVNVPHPGSNRHCVGRIGTPYVIPLAVLEECKYDSYGPTRELAKG